MRTWIRTLVLCAAPSLTLGALGALTVTPAHAQPAAATPAPDAVEKAQALFKKGHTLYEAKKYNQAVVEFRASYAAVPSPNSRLYIARSLRQMGELRDAYLEFDAVVEEAAAKAATEARYAKTQEQATVERDELTGKIAMVTVTVAHPESAGTLQIGGKEVPRERWGKPFPATPGPVEVVLTSKAGAPVQENLTLAAGDKRDVTLDAQPGGGAGNGSGAGSGSGSEGDDGVSIEASGPSSRAGLRPYAYIAGGVGVVGLGLFTVAGLMASSTYSDLSETCGGPCPPDRQDDVDAGKTQQTLANVGLIVGAVGIAAGATLFVLSVTGGSSSEKDSASSSQLVIGPSYAGLRGHF